MHLQTLTAFTDFSATAEHALDRAALVAAHHGAHLRIQYCADALDHRFDDPHARLEQRARQLARRHETPVTAVRQGTCDVVRDALAASAHSDLLVLDRRAESGLWSLLRGHALARILRGTQCPVLVVQRAPQAAYRRMLIAVDFSEASASLLRYASGLQDEALLEIYHAVDTRDEAKLRSAEASVESLRAYRAQMLEKARRRMLPLASACDARRNRVATAIGAGDPARELAVQHEAWGADLIAVGYTRRPPLAEWLLGSTAGRLMGRVACDVLVFPTSFALPQERAASRARAVSRVSA